MALHTFPVTGLSRSLFKPALRPPCQACTRLGSSLVTVGLISMAPVAGWAQTAASLPGPQTLPEVSVAGLEEDDSRGSVTQISAEELDAQGASNMADVVRYQPLVSAPAVASGSNNVWDGSGTTGYNVRGVEGNRVAIDVDGISLPPAETRPDGMSSNSFSTGRDTLEIELYKSVEIESGATASGRGGSSGEGGRVRFITKDPQDYLTSTRDHFAGYKLGYQSSDRSWLNAVTGAARVGSVQALAIYARRDGEDMRARGSPVRDHDDWYSNGLLTKFVWGADTENRLGLALEYFHRNSELENYNLVSASIPQAPRQHARDRRTRVSLEHDYIPVGGTPAFDRLQSRIYYQSSEARNDTYVPILAAGVRVPRPYSREVFTNSEHDTWGGGLEAGKLLGNHALYYGLSLSGTSSKRPWEDHRHYLDNGQVPPPVVQDRAAQADDGRYAVFVRDDIALDFAGRRATLTPGLTVQHYRIRPKNLEHYAGGSQTSAEEARRQTGTVWLPSLNFSVAVLPDFDAYTQYSRGARVPTVTELTGSYEAPTRGYAVLGNPDLKRESSDNFELGVRGVPTRGVRLNASVFYSEYRDFIDYVNLGYDPALPQFRQFIVRNENLGKARIWGTEASTLLDLGQWQPAIQGTTLSLAGGWLRGRATDQRTGEKGGLASALPAKVVAGLGWDDPGRRYGAMLYATWTDAKRADERNVLDSSQGEQPVERFRVPSATVLDLNSYWNISGNVTWRLGVYNLTNRKYWDYSSVRNLAAADTRDINRQTRPGRSVGTSLEVQF